MANADDLRDASPWHPMDKPVDIKHVGKLIEEVAELTTVTGRLNQALARCLIQGIDEKEPVTGKVNKEWLEDEVADVMAGTKLITERFQLDTKRMQERCAKKVAHLSQWHKLA